MPIDKCVYCNNTGVHGDEFTGGECYCACKAGMNLKSVEAGDGEIVRSTSGDTCISCAVNATDVGDLCIFCFHASVPKLASTYVDQLRAEVETLRKELADAQYWRRRHCLDAESYAKKAEEIWEHAFAVQRDRDEWKQEAEERDHSYAYWMKQANEQYTRAEEIAAKLAKVERRAATWKKAAKSFRAMREHYLARTEAWCRDYMNSAHNALKGEK